MGKRLILLGVIVFVFIAGESSAVLAASRDSPVEAREIEVGLDYMAPYDKDRQIETLSLNILVPFRQETANPDWSFYRGITVTRSWGWITRSEIDPDSSAFGLGPVYLARKHWAHGEKWRLDTDFSGALIFYNEHFPAGADNYNFMWRLSPRFTYQWNEQCDLTLGYQIMHISNGQFSHHEPTHNPGYNAVGFTVSLKRRF